MAALLAVWRIEELRFEVVQGLNDEDFKGIYRPSKDTMTLWWHLGASCYVACLGANTGVLVTRSPANAVIEHLTSLPILHFFGDVDPAQA